MGGFENECPNGHPANSDGNCMTAGCIYHVSNKNK